MKPKITIITPVYNGEKYLEQSIKSIVNQDYSNFEYIIVDGDSKDNTHKIINKYKNKISKVIIGKDKTMYEALRKGFKIASGDYFCWINSDDYLIDKYSVSRIVKAIDRYNYNWFNCNIAISVFNEKPKIYFPLCYPQMIIRAGLANNCFWGFIQQENTIFSRKLYEKVGGINANFKMAGDYDLWKRFSRYEKLHPLRIDFACHRKSNIQLTNLDYYYKEINKKKCLINITYPLRIIYSLINFPFIKKI